MYLVSLLMLLKHSHIQKQGLIGIEGFEIPSTDALSPDSVNTPSRMAKRFDVPKVPTSRTSTLPPNQSGSKLMSALDTPLPPIPPNQQFDSPRTSIISNDSGFGASEGAEFRRQSHHHRSGTSSVPSSGGGTFRRPASNSDSGKFSRTHIEVSVVGN